MHGLVEVPQLERAVLGGCDEHRVFGVKGHGPDGVKVAPQGETRVPRLLKLIPVILHLVPHTHTHRKEQHEGLACVKD